VARYLLAADPSDLDKSRSTCIGKVGARRHCQRSARLYPVLLPRQLPIRALPATGCGSRTPRLIISPSLSPPPPPQLRSNFTGTAYMLAAKRCATNHNMTKSFAQQALALHFASTVLTAAGGPRAMTAALPSPDGGAGRLAGGGGLDLAGCLEQAHARQLAPEAGRRLALLHSNPPERDARTGRGWRTWAGPVALAVCLLPSGRRRHEMDPAPRQQGTRAKAMHRTHDATARLMSAACCPDRPAACAPAFAVYTLDFPGRAGFKASVKNAQLVGWDPDSGGLGSQVLLQFAKIQRNTYCCDFAYPLSAFQAFAVGG
jgi:hypothetical protein